MIDLIEKKRDGGELSSAEMNWMISAYCAGEVPDYQMSAFLMAVHFRGMTARETHELTMAMLHSGETIDLSGLGGITADKHSTGGVGDKTSLVLCPTVASQGVRMAKMSGRGLGFTGGTLDKLESIPGFTSALTRERFFENVRKVGFAIAAQTAEIDPADKKLYALRDVTGTVGIRPLIVSSVMSKKLAAGADVIVLDVKTGAGSFCPTEEDAFALARDMVEVGKQAGRKTVALVTGMEEPLGYAVGNALEVKEAIAALSGAECGNLTELCLTLGSVILTESGRADSTESARDMLRRSIDSGAALDKFAEFVAAQGGDASVARDTSILPQAPVVRELYAEKSGYISAINAAGVGRTSTILGGGRANKDDVIDLSVGVVLKKKTGDFAEKGECLALIHAKSEQSADEAQAHLRECFSQSDGKPTLPPFVRGIVR
jgi:pyrimidine-nucleoside phosphorylase